MSQYALTAPDMTYEILEKAIGQPERGFSLLSDRRFTRQHDEARWRQLFKLEFATDERWVRCNHTNWYGGIDWRLAHHEAKDSLTKAIDMVNFPEYTSDEINILPRDCTDINYIYAALNGFDVYCAKHRTETLTTL